MVIKEHDFTIFLEKFESAVVEGYRANHSMVYSENFYEVVMEKPVKPKTGKQINLKPAKKAGKPKKATTPKPKKATKKAE